MAWRLKEQDIGRIATFFHLATLLLGCFALAQRGWFHIRGRPCPLCAPCPSHLAPADFFTVTEYSDQPMTLHFQLGNVDEVMQPPVTVSYPYNQNTGIACVTPRLANLMRIVILLCFMVIIFSIISLFLSVASLKNETLKIIQRNALLSILSVLWVIGIVGVCYYITLIIQDDIGRKKIDVSFEYGFYTITATGVMAVLGTALSLLTPPNSEHISLQRRHLADDWDNPEAPPPSCPIIVNSFAPIGPRRPLSIGRSSMRTLPDSASLDSDLVAMTPPPPYTP